MSRAANTGRTYTEAEVRRTHRDLLQVIDRLQADLREAQAEVEDLRAEERRLLTQIRDTDEVSEAVQALVERFPGHVPARHLREAILDLLQEGTEAQSGRTYYRAAHIEHAVWHAERAQALLA